MRFSTDADLERLLWQLIGGTRGGITRARILHAITDRPYNTNQLADALDLDYTTVQYHLRILQENGLVEADGADYGELHHPAPVLADNLETFQRIWAKIDKDGQGGGR